MTEYKSALKGDVKLSWSTRLAYAGGDVACNIVFGTVGSVLTLFYTDYVGVDPVKIGIVFLIARIFGIFSDFVIGFLVERTKSKWGKARPWILWMSFPFSISTILLFTVPHTTENLMILYIFVTYFLCNTIFYTAVNLPYGSLSSMMTRNAKERGVLSIVRMGLSPLGRIFSVTFTLPLVGFFGGDESSWVIVMTFWVIIGQVLLLICFFKCEENVVIPGRRKDIKNNDTPIIKSLIALFKNQYFWAVLILWTLQSVSFNISGTLLSYYSRYVLNVENPDLLYSNFFLVETVALIICIFLSAPFIWKFGKRNVALFGAFIALFGQLLLLIDSTNITILYATCILRGIGLAPLNAVVFAMIGDAVEFGQWKTHLRQEGFIYAGGSIGTKIGAGVASMAITSLLSSTGYIASTTGGAIQPASAVSMISYLYFIGPLLIALGSIIVLSFYKLDKKYNRIMEELAIRESKNLL